MLGEIGPFKRMYQLNGINGILSNCYPTAGEDGPRISIPYLTALLADKSQLPTPKASNTAVKGDGAAEVASEELNSVCIHS